MRKDYYAVLGVKPGASDKEIRSAYKRLARRYHPDVNPNDRKAADRFREVTEAYEVLSDPQKRQMFDGGASDFDPRTGGAGYGGASGRVRSGARRSTAGPFHASGTGGFGSILDELMRGMGGAPGGRGGFSGVPEPGPDLQCDAQLSFEEAVLGTTLTLPLARNVACEGCGGSGMARGARRAACSTCHGGGTQRATETIQTRIPPGVEHGARVRVPGKGEAGSGAGAPAGDLFIAITIAPHPWFRREGSDILLDLPLSFAEAALGARVEVPTLGGRVTLTVPPGSRSGQKLRLRGRGVPGRESGKSGDQIVMLQIVAPQAMDERSKSLVEELDRLNPGSPRADLGW